MIATVSVSSMLPEFTITPFNDEEEALALIFAYHVREGTHTIYTTISDAETPGNPGRHPKIHLSLLPTPRTTNGASCDEHR